MLWHCFAKPFLGIRIGLLSNNGTRLIIPLKDALFEQYPLAHPATTHTSMRHSVLLCVMGGIMRYSSMLKEHAIPLFIDFLLSEASATSILSAVFANESCDPFTGPTAQCIVGRYPSYSVNITTPAHAIAAVNFARQHNIRFIVKNTGHE